MINNFVPAMALLTSRVNANPDVCDLSVTGEIFYDYELRQKGQIIELIEAQVANPAKKMKLGTGAPPAPKVLKSVTVDDLRTYAKFLDKTGYGDYSDVKTDTVWKAIYDVKSRSLPHKNGKVTSTKAIESSPCLRCGFIFPVDNITVDHQRPQSGGGFAAMLKVFRAMDLTMDGASGLKGQTIFDAVINKSVVAKSKRTDQAHVSATGFRGRRYELSYEGMLVYSVMRAITSKSILLQACMHNACNLAPLCAVCNSSKNNTWHY
ncbi:hypothetical protein [uncultured Fibrella sp.]|uniref:hypothetical protein n=1 Tax=uncultured Fibrella sp. TaxID=1284596 RepID=UPI0035CB23F9